MPATAREPALGARHRQHGLGLVREGGSGYWSPCHAHVLRLHRNSRRGCWENALPQTFYRIVKADPPTLRDFMSLQELGQCPRNPNDPEVLRRWDKVSVWADERRARQWARAHPQLGAYIAQIELPDTSGIAAERSGPIGHYSLTARAEELWQYVRSVVPVDPAG